MAPSIGTARQRIFEHDWTVDGSTLDRARAGDEAAFHDLTTPHLKELRLHCYRMLGSLADAEDALQETLTAAWRALSGFEQRSTYRAWLYRIATNRCLNAIRSAKRRPPPEPLPPFEPPEPSRRGEVTWLQPYPDAWLEQVAGPEPGPAGRYQSRETIELGFIAALQLLPPRQTAALVLCDVVGFTIAEAAVILKTSTGTVKGTLQRARASLDRHRPPHTAPPAGSSAERDLAERFAAAFVSGDVDGLVGLLTEESWLAMPPAGHEYLGRNAIAGFLRASSSWRGRRRLALVPTRANTQPAYGVYLSDLAGNAMQPTGIVVLTLDNDRVLGITRFLDERLPDTFGLTTPGSRDPWPNDHVGRANRGWPTNA